MTEELRRQDDYRIEALTNEVGEVKKDIRNMKENHLAHIERDMATASNDLEWLKRFFWLIAGGLVSNLAASLFLLL